MLRNLRPEYLQATATVKEGAVNSGGGFLGVDLGMAHIAYDSDGQAFCGEKMRQKRRQKAKTRRQLQQKGSKSSKRKLKRRGRKESRHRHDVNHCISKKLVEKAQRTKRTIVLEDLKGIRSRIRASRELRYELHSWAFYDLQQKILYKARRAGVLVQFVGAAYTSQRCFVCGHTEKGNRRSQSEFVCKGCGGQSHADENAAKNIAWKGALEYLGCVYAMVDLARVQGSPLSAGPTEKVSLDLSNAVQLELF